MCRPATGRRGYVNYSMGGADNDPEACFPIPSHLLKVGLAARNARGDRGGELRYESGRKTLVGTRTDPVPYSQFNFAIHPFHPHGAAMAPSFWF